MKIVFHIFVVLLVWGAFSDERMGLQFTRTNPTEPCQCCHSCLEVPKYLRPYLTLPFEAGFPFSRFLRLRGLRWKYSNAPPHVVCSSSQSYLTTDDQSASPSLRKASIWDHPPIFLSLPWELSWHLRFFFNLVRPLWREGGPVIYGCCWASAKLSRFGVPRNSWPNFTVSTLRFAQLRRAGFCVCYPRNTVAQFNFQPLKFITLHALWLHLRSICAGLLSVQDLYSQFTLLKVTSSTTAFYSP
jgi:hypothetical protein